MSKEVDSGLSERLSRLFNEMRSSVDSIDSLLHGKLDGATKTRISETLQSKGYFVADYNPLYLFGSSFEYEGIKISPILIGSNGCLGRKEVRLECKYVPEGYKPEDILSPPGEDTDNFELKEKEYSFQEYFSEHLKMDIEFREGYFTLSRDLRLDPQVLLMEINRFKRDLELTKVYLDREGKDTQTR